MDRGVVLLASGASATLHVPFILHSCACMFLHFPFIYSVHVHSNVHSCPFIFLSFACIFLSFCIHVLSFVEMALWLGQGTECNKWLSLRLSLKNPSNIWHCSKEMYHKNDRVRERERARASEFDAKWYGNCRKQCTTGWISLIGFARSVNVHNSICLVYAKFNGLSCMVPGYRFLGGPIALQSFVHISDKKLRQY